MQFVTKNGSLVVTNPERGTVANIQITDKNLTITVSREDNVAAFEDQFQKMELTDPGEQVVHDVTNAVIAFLKGEAGFDAFDGKTNAFHLEQFLTKNGK